jgi:hypothetical protein
MWTCRVNNELETTLNSIRGFADDVRLGVENRVLRLMLFDIRRPLSNFNSVHELIIGFLGAILGEHSDNVV